jgi:hypothetical protein
MAEYDSWGWHAHPYVGREFYAPWGDFDVTINIDKDYVVAATGYLQNPEEIGYGYEDEGMKVKRKGKKLSWNFKAENVHDFLWAADPDYTHTKAEVPEGPTLHFFYQKDSLTENWESLPEYAVKAFEFISENFGKYPYDKYSIIQGGDGGMEYPMATLITGHRNLPSLVGVTVHEALHSWYQGVLATNESYYAWMDEGFTTYATSLTMDHLFPSGNQRPALRNYRAYYALATSDKEEPLSTHADHFNTNFAYGLGSYYKGAVAVAQLAYVIGEENLSKGMIRYFDTWKFKHPDDRDFARVMEKESGIELDWYFDYWVNTIHTIDYGIDTVLTNESETVVQLERVGMMPMPLDVVVTKTDGTQIMYYIPLGIMRGEKPNETGMEREIMKDWFWTHPKYELVLDLAKDEITSIEIDPSNRMADIDRENNTFNIE